MKNPFHCIRTLFPQRCYGITTLVAVVTRIIYCRALLHYLSETTFAWGSRQGKNRSSFIFCLRPKETALACLRPIRCKRSFEISVAKLRWRITTRDDFLELPHDSFWGKSALTVANIIAIIVVILFSLHYVFFSFSCFLFVCFSRFFLWGEGWGAETSLFLLLLSPSSLLSSRYVFN